MKAQRQAKIVEIISNANVETQEQLLQALPDAGAADIRPQRWSQRLGSQRRSNASTAAATTTPTRICSHIAHSFACILTPSPAPAPRGR